MKFLLFSVCVLGIAVGNSIGHEYKCPPNEVFSDNADNACQNTCKFPTRSSYCKGGKIPGCVCVEGHLRNNHGVCVPAKHCPCDDVNEVFDLCDKTVENTCQYPDLKAVSKPTGCNPGCVCKPGFLRSKNDKCVEPAHCKHGCGGDKNAVWDKCGDRCQITCQNVHSKPKCLDTCLEKGACICKQGFVKNLNGTCIKQEKCLKCKHDEIVACKFDCNTRCDNLGEHFQPEDHKSLSCKIGCYCQEGYVHDHLGYCVPINHCPCKHDENAVISEHGDPCPKTCENRFHYNEKDCKEKPIPYGCKCVEGHVLDHNNKCIPEEHCPEPKCPANEEFVHHPDCPDIKCSDYHKGKLPECHRDENHPEEPGCRCKHGLVRNDKGHCVEVDECCKDPNAEMAKNPNPCKGGTCDYPEFAKCDKKPNPYGCQCKQGYVKKSDSDSTCVKRSECHHK